MYNAIEFDEFVARSPGGEPAKKLFLPFPRGRVLILIDLHSHPRIKPSLLAGKNSFHASFLASDSSDRGIPLIAVAPRDQAECDRFLQQGRKFILFVLFFFDQVSRSLWPHVRIFVAGYSVQMSIYWVAGQNETVRRWKQREAKLIARGNWHAQGHALTFPGFVRRGRRVRVHVNRGYGRAAGRGG